MGGGKIEKQDVVDALGFEPVKSINGATGDVVIGGTQILRRTNNPIFTDSYKTTETEPGLWGWAATAENTIRPEEVYIQDPPINGITKGITIKKEVSSGYTGIGTRNGRVEDLGLTPGDTYTFSVYVKGVTENVRLQVDYGNPESHFQKIFKLNSPEKWTRISFTHTVLDVGILGSVAIILYSADSSITVCGMKLEKGNIATGWTPAPEDYIALEARVAALEAAKA